MTRTLTLLSLTLLLTLPIYAQDEEPDYPVDPTLFQAMAYRNIGPFRGGRVTAAAGIPGNPMKYYMGSTGGGVWMTEDAGNTWKNISDGFFKTGSVGALAIAASDPNVIYVGMGESPVRGVTTSHGDGVYKSTDAGKTWTHMGLDKTRQISHVHIHPQNPDLVYVAAQGSPYGATAERGIYKSTDGGESWRLVLHVDEDTGASDLTMDVTNPRILYAGMWHHRRLPWQVISGSESSGVYKSVDAGETWEKLTEGLPEVIGKVGVAVSPAKPERVWAIVEADEGGLFRSDDSGKTWTRVNEERVLRARSWYYTHVFADTQDEETVYVLNAPMLKSIDGGATFKPVPTPHGDNHHLWIHPDNNKWMINTNDGGANISFNGGETWSTQENQPTAQFYRVNTDNRENYMLYGGQQDNSSVAIHSRSRDAGIGREDWHPGPGCESAYTAFDPDNPRYLYGGCYQGIISEYDAVLHETRSIMAYPFLGLGSNAEDQKYRFNWNAPIHVSHHDPTVIYHAGNQLLRSRDRGTTWEEMSPDLTRDEVEKQGLGGAPITNEAAGAEVYNTIFAIAESPHEEGVIYAGTDDGLVHITRDGGESWDDITPRNFGEWLVNSIEISSHDPATAYMAVNNYKMNDFTPRVYKTTNYGGRWDLMAEGFGDDAWVRVVREDPGREGLLYAGTELGMYISFDGGAQWQPFQLNLPIVPITDMQVQNNDIAVATQGRAFWVLDDLSPLHEMSDALADEALHLFQPSDALRISRGGRPQLNMGQNPPSGAILYYTLGDIGDSTDVSLDILDEAGEVIRAYTSKTAPGTTAIPKKEGMNRFVWNFQVDALPKADDYFIFGGLNGYRVAPGTYQARLTAGEHSMTHSFEVLPDPMKAFDADDFTEQQALLATIHSRTSTLHETITHVNDVKTQVADVIKRTAEFPGAEAIKEAGESLTKDLDAWLDTVIQRKQKTFQDVINFPNKLNAHLIHLMGLIDGSDLPLTEGKRMRFNDLLEEWDDQNAVVRDLLDNDVPAFNALVQEQAVPAVVLPEVSGEERRPGS